AGGTCGSRLRWRRFVKRAGFVGNHVALVAQHGVDVFAQRCGFVLSKSSLGSSCCGGRCAFSSTSTHGGAVLGDWTSRLFSGGTTHRRWAGTSTAVNLHGAGRYQCVAWSGRQHSVCRVSKLLAGLVGSARG